MRRAGPRQATTLLATTLVVTPACSTLAPLPTPVECESDEDCPNDGELCAPDTRVCVPVGNLPPRADLGFDIQELAGGQVLFRAEIGGCDREIEASQSRLALRGREVEQTFELAVFARTPEDPAVPVVDDLLPAAIELSQPSRLGRAPLAPPRLDYPALDESADVVTVLPTTARWPRYHPYDAMPPALKDGGFVLWRTLPVDGAPVLQMFVPPKTKDLDCTDDSQCCRDPLECTADEVNFCLPGVGQCTAIGNPRFAFNFKYDDRCSRELAGDVVVIDGETLETRGVLGGVPLTVRHADTPAMDRLGVHAIDAIAPADRPAQCSSDDDCIAGEQLCDPDTDQCVLAIAGRIADGGTATVEDGSFVTKVYTYCEAEGNVGLVRSFTVSAAPSGPLAALSYTFDASIGPLGAGDQKPIARVPKRLCVPDWGEPVPLSLQLVGDAIPLVGGDDGYVCCDVGCLPASALDAAGSEPTQLSECDGRTSAGAVPTVTVSATLTLDAAGRDAWDEADCVPPDTDALGVVGGIRRSTECSDPGADATCVVPNLAAGADGSPREYELRLQSPVGSLFRSVTTTVEVTDATPQEIMLERRVLVRGRVLLDADGCQAAATVDGDCGSEGALVRAERLRMPGETANDVVGPYFHEVPTFYDPIALTQGGYVLPLDPGVYLITALPLSGSRGGPAEIAILDLREGVDLERDLVLSTGVLVTLDLTGFDPRAQILPIDRGSWRNLIHPGRAEDPDEAVRTVDLNAIGECLQPADEVPQACRIRRLISGSSLSASQVGQVRFTARADPDAGSCPN